MGASPSIYPLELRTQAIALYRQCLNASQVARELGLEERTVSNWCRRFRELSTEQEDAKLLDDDYRLASDSGDLLHDALDHIKEAGPEMAVKFIMPLNAVRGTSIDKILERRKAGAPQIHTGPFMVFQEIVVNTPPPPTTDTFEGHTAQADNLITPPPP